MPLLLDTIAGNLRKGTIELRGQKLEARVPTARESLRIRALLGKPVPPMRMPATKGSKAEPEPDFADPGYNRELFEWSEKVELLELAVALDLDLGGGSPATGPKVYDCNVHGEREAPKLPKAAGFGRFDLTRSDGELADWIRDAADRLLDGFGDGELASAQRQLRMLAVRDVVGEAEKN